MQTTTQCESKNCLQFAGSRHRAAKCQYFYTDQNVNVKIWNNDLAWSCFLLEAFKGTGTRIWTRVIVFELYNIFWTSTIVGWLRFKKLCNKLHFPNEGSPITMSVLLKNCLKGHSCNRHPGCKPKIVLYWKWPSRLHIRHFLPVLKSSFWQGRLLCSNLHDCAKTKIVLSILNTSCFQSSDSIITPMIHPFKWWKQDHERWQYIKLTFGI